MAVNSLPTASQLASAEAHLFYRQDWRFYRVNGVRYVSMKSGTSGRIYQVRADGQGCSCDAYQKWGYVICSHGLAVVNAATIETLAAFVDEQADAADRLLDEYDSLEDLAIDAMFAQVSAQAGARQAARKSYRDLFPDED